MGRKTGLVVVEVAFPFSVEYKYIYILNELVAVLVLTNITNFNTAVTACQTQDGQCVGRYAKK